MLAVDWQPLLDAASMVMRNAYTPYVPYKVGAAALVDDGRVLVGCNVANASFGLGLCAECGIVSALHASGGGRLVALVCVDSRGDVLMPCGRCRQLLWEHGGPELLVQGKDGVHTMAELMPHPFGASDLSRATALDEGS